MYCGLGNNGGSSTIVRSANALVELGHDVTIIDTGKNCHTWTPLNATFRKINDINKLPAADAIIATGYGTVKSTVNAPARCGKKFHWIRGWETWNFIEEKIKKMVLDQPTIKIVNSICLQDKLKSLGHASYIVRPGYDFNEIFPVVYNKAHKNVILGGLYNWGSKRSGKRVRWIFETARFLKKNYDHVVLFMYGADGVPAEDCVDQFIRHPTIAQKNEMLNSIDIWLAPTELEGLHIAPAEAMLTQATVVGTCAPMSGMQDYLLHNKTGIITDNDQASFTNAVEELIFKPEDRMFLGLNGREKILSLGSRKQNMLRMVEILEKFV